METQESALDQAIETTGQILETGAKLNPGSSIEFSSKLYNNALLAYDTAVFAINCIQDPNGERLYFTEIGGKVIKGTTFAVVLGLGIKATIAVAGTVEVGSGGWATPAAAYIYAKGTSWSFIAVSGAGP